MAFNYPQFTSYQGLRGRPVTSIEEAKAMQIDFDGSMFFFPDMAHKRLYTKQLQLDGTAPVKAYELVEVKEQNQSAFVTKEEFERAIQEINAVLAKGEKDAEQPSPNDQFTSF